jgi:ketosteroid isomerase-like protein
VAEAVEVVRNMLAAFQRGDYERSLAAYSENVEWDGRNLPDGKLGRGHAAIADHVERWAAQWTSWTVEVEEVLEVAPGVVIVYTRERGRSTSGLEMDERHAEAYVVREGKIVRRVGFSDPGEALGVVETW